MAEYISRYTGEQIEEAVGKALTAVNVIPLTTEVDDVSNYVTALDIDGIPHLLVGIPSRYSGNLYKHTITFVQSPFPNHTVTIITPRSYAYESATRIVDDYYNIVDFKVGSSEVLYTQTGDAYYIGFYVSEIITNYPLANVIMTDYVIERY